MGKHKPSKTGHGQYDCGIKDCKGGCENNPKSKYFKKLQLSEDSKKNIKQFSDFMEKNKFDPDTSELDYDTFNLMMTDEYNTPMGKELLDSFFYPKMILNNIVKDKGLSLKDSPFDFNISIQEYFEANEDKFESFRDESQGTPYGYLFNHNQAYPDDDFYYQSYITADGYTKFKNRFYNKLVDDIGDGMEKWAEGMSTLLNNGDIDSVCSKDTLEGDPVSTKMDLEKHYDSFLINLENERNIPPRWIHSDHEKIIKNGISKALKSIVDNYNS